jgi:hypothetical protein
VQLKCARADGKLERDHPAGSAPSQGVKRLMLALVEDSDGSSRHELTSSSAVPGDYGAVSSPSSIAKANAVNMTADVPPAANALSRVGDPFFVVSTYSVHARAAGRSNTLSAFLQT